MLFIAFLYLVFYHKHVLVTKYYPKAHFKCPKVFYPHGYADLLNRFPTGQQMVFFFSLLDIVCDERL